MTGRVLVVWTVMWGCGPSQPEPSSPSDPSSSSSTELGDPTADTGLGSTDSAVTRDTGDSGPWSTGDSGWLPTADTGQPQEVAPGIYRLDGTAADTPATDLAVLDPLLAEAAVIAFGESVHYSGGFHALRDRAMRYAIEEHGARAVGIEGHWLIAEENARPYVERCDGTVPEALVGLTFDVWASQEAGDFLSFLCAWNTDHPDDPVTFFGVDVQAPWLDSRWLLDVFAAVPDGTDGFTGDLAQCAGWGLAPTELDQDDELWAILTGTGAGIDPLRTSACLDGVAAAEGWVTDQEAELASVDAETPVLARVALRSLRTGHLTFANLRDWDPRDEGMAGNFLDLHALRAPDAPAIYWAHNAHIVASGETLTDSVYPDGWKDAGSHLRDALGDRYVPIALMATDVTWNWYGQPEQTTSAVAGTVERRLHGLGEELLFVDVAVATADGSVLPDLAYPFGHPGTATGRLADHYDGVLFLAASGPMTYWSP